MASCSEAYSYEGMDPKLIKKAEKELNENPRQVRAHIASLRRWLTSMPHIQCRSDDEFLLRFLRVSKFDQSRAQIMLDNYCTIRTSPRGSKDWFTYRPLEDPVVQGYLQCPMHMFLGCTPTGECVIMASMQGWDVNKLTFVDFLRCNYMAVDLLVRDQRMQIGGMKIVINMANASKAQLSNMENPKTMFTAFRNWQDAFPIRMKAVIYINEPPIFDFIFSLIKNGPFIKEKMKNRLHRVGKDMNKLKTLIGPGADDILPAELGGKNGNFEELLKKKRAMWEEEASKKEWEILQQIRVDEDKRQAATKDYLKTFDGGSGDPNMGISGTFTKLNVD